MKKLFVSIVLLSLALYSACDSDGIATDPLTHEKEAIVQSTCQILHDALENYANDNMGQYPVALESAEEPGTLIIASYLPDGYQLVNPFTDEEYIPSSEESSSSGVIKYEPEIVEPGTTNGYMLVGRGGEDVIVTIHNSEEYEQTVIDNCFVLKYAMEAYAAENNGLLPDNFTTENISGKTIVNYLPNDEYLYNPATDMNMEPSFWYSQALYRGAIGVLTENDRLSSLITGAGRSDGMIIIMLTIP